MSNTSLLDRLNDKVQPFAEKIGGERHLMAISDGMFLSLPFMVIGAFFLIVANPPINMDQYDPATANVFMQALAAWKTWATENYNAITTPYNLTFGLTGLISAFGIAHSLADEYRLPAANSGIISVVTFLMVATPVADGTIQTQYLGADGLFVAIIIGLLSVEVTHFMDKRNMKLTLPPSIPPAVATFMSSLLPLLANIVIFYGINLAFIAGLGLSFPAAVMQALTPGLDIANSLPGFLLVVTLGQVLWLFGVNGSSIIFPIVFTLGVAETGLNADQFAAGEALTHVMNLQMYRISVMGGAGNTLGLIILMILSKVPENRTLGKLALIPGICGINEPVIFGLPVVFNPIIAIPFILTPIITLTLTYVAQSVGLIGLGYIVDPSFTPFFAQAFLSSMDWRNVVFTLVLIPLSLAIYYPFFKVYEKSQLKRDEEALEKAAR